MERATNALTSCFTKDSNLVTRRIAGETIIVPVRAHVANLDYVYTLNEVGTLIWELINGRTSVSEIVEAVCSQYDIAPKEAAKDVLDFLGSLEAASLIHPSVEN